MATFLKTTQRTCTTELTDIGPHGLDVQTPAGKVRTATVRFANIGNDDANADLKIVDTGVPAAANDGYRMKNYPVPYNQPGSAPDEGLLVVLTAGQKLQQRASAANAIASSVIWVEDDA